MKLLKLTIGLLTLSLLSIGAHASVGKVLFTHGVVTVEKPAPESLTKGMPVDEGDVVVTGPKGYAQILLDDNTKIAIRPDSRLSIVAVERPAGPGGPAIGAGLTPRTQLSLLKGGFRTLTGDIAEENPASYQVSTPSAVIGIRGTNYVARLCSGDCSPGTEDGLFVGVSDGAVYLANDGGDLDLSRNQFGFARNFTSAPVRLIAPPPSLQDESSDLLLEEEEEEGEGEEEATAQTEGESGEESTEAEGEAEEAASEFGGDTEVADTEATAEPASTATASSSGPDQEITAVTASGGTVDLTGGGNVATQPFTFSTEQFSLATVAAASTLTTDANESLTGFQARGSSGATEAYDIGTSTHSNAGYDPLTELKWGRWSGGISTVDGQNLDLTNSSLHYVIAADTDGPSQVITGTAEYFIVGNTDPTDNQGNVGILGAAHLDADFTNATVFSEVQLSISNQVWHANGSGSITDAAFSGLYDSVSIGGSGNGTGSFDGIFTGFASGLTPVGAALNYNLQDGSGTIVNGAAVLIQDPSQ